MTYLGQEVEPWKKEEDRQNDQNTSNNARHLGPATCRTVQPGSCIVSKS